MRSSELGRLFHSKVRRLLAIGTYSRRSFSLYFSSVPFGGSNLKRLEMAAENGRRSNGRCSWANMESHHETTICNCRTGRCTEHHVC